MTLRLTKNQFLFMIFCVLVIVFGVAFLNEKLWIDPDEKYLIIKGKNQGIFLIDKKISICYPLSEMLLLKIDPDKIFDFEMFKRSNCRNLF